MTRAHRTHRTKAAYRALWNCCAGAIQDAMNQHPDIVIPPHRIDSVVKRVAGNVLALAGAARGRAADRGGGGVFAPPPEGDGSTVRPAPGGGAQPNGAAATE